ncbi:hypothetical protein GCM10007079_28150 [Nocardiopsis terrae]|uniref:TPR repeat protein n=1 Tax=Nocardiopsis terrae TaxID=372655 RepID=A0ABR9HEW9_9ACTN|nr:tetratricopeptide repeat protein [Nocardiopsis terrae]MBE1457581.1 TPR repeat protein [Nocardiopsis terrae]GHC85359.1 hypothetical protein GCM10007079_28150 [Nocardiopsis terrae]
MRRMRVWVLATIGAALLLVLGASLLLPGLEELSWAAGAGSFVLAAAAMALAWTPPKRASTPLAQAPEPEPAGAGVNNRMGENHGVSIQAGAIHGPVTVNTPPAQAGAPVPGWVEIALPVHQADARDLGAHDALPGAEDAGLPPYVARDVDDELDRRLSAAAEHPRGGMVLVAGASTAGKTRALAAALARALPDRMLVAPPEDTDLRSLPTWLQERTKRNPQGWVVWLDDLDRHLSSSGLTPALVAELGRTGALVAATIRRERLDSLRPSATDPAPGSERAGYAVLKTPPVVVNRRWSLPERERARASADERLVQAAADERFGVAEQLAAGPLLQQAWRDGPDSGHPRGYALVAAAVGLAQAGVSSPLTREQLHTAHSAYLPDPPPLPEETDRAWEWATQPRSGLAGLLVPADHDGLRWRAFDYLTLPDPLPDAVWQNALDAATDQDRLDVGLTAYHADRADVAETAWLRVAREGDSLAMFNLGQLLERRGETDGAEHWYRRAAQQGNTFAMHNLRLLLTARGETDEAEDWYRRANRDGDGLSTLVLGMLLKDPGEAGEAEAWNRLRAQEGSTSAMFDLGNLLKGRGETDEAEHWYRHAAQGGKTLAMFDLGNLLERRGETDEAEHWYRHAAQQDDLTAIAAPGKLGHLLRKQGRTREAEDWYRRAAQEGYISAMSELGNLLEKRGETDEAEHWYRRAEEGERHLWDNSEGFR